MNLLEIRNAIITYWNEEFKSVPTEYPNTPFPDNLRERPYVSLSIDMVNGKSVIKGGGTSTRHWGNIHIVIRVPTSTGNRVAYELANEALELMERKRIYGANGSIVTRAGSIDDLSRPREQFGMLVSIPFYATC